jgi:hypothetical protein
MNAALSGKGYVPDVWAQDEVMADNQTWEQPPNNKRRPRPGRGNDFTRALFGF